MSAILVPLVGLALLDSLNPSALTVTFVLVVGNLHRRARMSAAIISYAIGIVVSTIIVGAALILGLKLLLSEILSKVSEHSLDIAQLCIGIVILLIGLLVPTKPRKRRAVRGDRSVGTYFAMGLGVTALELPSAIPFLGAIGLIARSELSPIEWAPLLGGYSLVTILPILIVLLVAFLAGPKIQGWAERNAERMQNAGRGLILTLIFIIGLVITADALVRLEFFGMIQL